VDDKGLVEHFDGNLGTETDALDAAAEANAHATQSPLKQKERRRLVVAMAGRHPEWPHEKIGSRLGLSHDAVRLILGAEKVISSISTTNIRIPDTTARAMSDALLHGGHTGPPRPAKEALSDRHAGIL